jgi:hypothetical protein
MELAKALRITCGRLHKIFSAEHFSAVNIARTAKATSGNRTSWTAGLILYGESLERVRRWCGSH